MQIVFLIPEYFVWHYTTAPRLTLNIITNFLWFTFHFFSLPVLWETLFAPWQLSRAEDRIHANSGGASSIRQAFSEAVLQIFGAFVRIATLILGGLICIGVCIAGAVLFLVWLVLPLIVVAFIITACKLLFA